MTIPLRQRYILLATLLVFPLALHAAYTPTPTPIPTDNILDGFVGVYKTKAQLWQSVLATHAQWIFWTLAIIEFAWMGIRLALRQADFQEFTIEIVKRLMFIGFFFALLTFGGDWAQRIIDSFYKAANDASSASGGLPGISPSSLFDMAADLFLDVTTHMGFFDVVAGLASVLCGLVLCVALAITVSFLVVALIETYLAVNAGIILLGFGGSRFTKDYAIAYLKFALGTAFKLFLTQLIIAIGGAIIMDWMAYAHAHPDDTTVQGLMLLAAVSIVQAILVGKIPGLAQGLVNGSSVGGGDELAAPAKVAAAGAGMLTGVGATITAAKTAFSSSVGAARAVRSATAAAKTAVPPTAGQGFGDRVGAAVSRLTNNQTAGAAATRAATAFARSGAVARAAGSMLVRAARDDARAHNTGTDPSPGVHAHRGTLGGRIAATIQRKR